MLAFQAVLGLKAWNPPASASCVLRSHACVTTPHLIVYQVLADTWSGRLLTAGESNLFPLSSEPWWFLFLQWPLCDFHALFTLCVSFKHQPVVGYAPHTHMCETQKILAPSTRTGSETATPLTLYLLLISVFTVHMATATTDTVSLWESVIPKPLNQIRVRFSTHWPGDQIIIPCWRSGPCLRRHWAAFLNSVHKVAVASSSDKPMAPDRASLYWRVPHLGQLHILQMVKLDIARQFLKMVNFYSHSARLGSFDFLTSLWTVNDASV